MTITKITQEYKDNLEKTGREVIELNAITESMLKRIITKYKDKIEIMLLVLRQ